MNRAGRAGTPLFAVLAFLAGLAVAQPGPAPSARAQSPRAGLVVQFAPGKVREFCVDLGGNERTGEELLHLAGLDVLADVTALGALVCSINGTGCAFPTESCLCKCQVLGGDCTYWTYFTVQDGRWKYENRGAASRTVHDGDVDGWSWGPGGEGRGLNPPPRTFADVCAALPSPGPSNPPPAMTQPARLTATWTPRATVGSGAPTAARPSSGGTAGFATATPPGGAGAPSQTAPPGGTSILGRSTFAGTKTPALGSSTGQAGGTTRLDSDSATATIAALEAQAVALGALATRAAVTPDRPGTGKTADPGLAEATPTLRAVAMKPQVPGPSTRLEAQKSGGWGGLGTFLLALVVLGGLWAWSSRRGRVS